MTFVTLTAIRSLEEGWRSLKTYQPRAAFKAEWDEVDQEIIFGSHAWLKPKRGYCQ